MFFVHTVDSKYENDSETVNRNLSESWVLPTVGVFP